MEKQRVANCRPSTSLLPSVPKISVVTGRLSDATTGSESAFNLHDDNVTKDSSVLGINATTASPEHYNCTGAPNSEIRNAFQESILPLGACSQRIVDETDESSFISSSDEGYDDDESISESDDEEETRMARALVKAAFRSVTSPALDRLLRKTFSSVAASIPSTQQRYKRKGSSDDEPNSFDFHGSPSKRQCVVVYPASGKNVSMSLMRSQQNRTQVPFTPFPKVTPFPAASCLKLENPDDHLRNLLKESSGFEPRLLPSCSIPDFFLMQTEESMAAYDLTLTQALRAENIEELRSIHKAGRTMQCGNKFGETIIHAACRRGAVEVLNFLLDECHVSVKVCCDSGRTPLHDAFWTAEPNFALVDILLDECPDLLYITDKRGFTPMAFVRREHWADWCRYLDRRGAEKLKPVELM